MCLTSRNLLMCQHPNNRPGTEETSLLQTQPAPAQHQTLQHQTLLCPLTFCLAMKTQPTQAAPLTHHAQELPQTASPTPSPPQPVPIRLMSPSCASLPIPVSWHIPFPSPSRAHPSTCRIMQDPGIASGGSCAAAWDAGGSNPLGSGRLEGGVSLAGWLLLMFDGSWEPHPPMPDTAWLCLIAPSGLVLTCETQP